MTTKYPACPLPVPKPTHSYWLSQPNRLLENYTSASYVPGTVDIVIIGSGITGALIAHQLQARYGTTKKIVMLEARSLCSGASGRNGGHIKPDCYKNFAKFEAQFGTEEAVRLCRFELANMRESVAFIREQGLAEECDLVTTRAVDVFMTQQAWDDAGRSIAAYKKAVGEIEEVHVYRTDELERENIRFNGAFGAVVYPACSLWPYKLVVGLIHKAVEKGLVLFTNTPALGIQSWKGSNDSLTRHWVVKTPKGPVKCAHIFHATNGYVSHLLPEFSGKIVPLKGNVVALDPPQEYVAKPMTHTTGVQWGDDFDYMIQRPNDGRPLIYGGRDLADPRGFTACVGEFDDSTVTSGTIQGLQDFPNKYMKGWNSPPSSSPRFAWSGIMGLTPDELPYVGEVPGRSGNFTAAGYSGHGMARAYLTVKGLMQGYFGDTVDPRIPLEYFRVKERLASREPSWEELLERNLEASARGQKLTSKL